MTLLPDAFISYGRPDSKDFAIFLCQRLGQMGYSVWIDQEDIPFAVNYQTHIDKSIEKAHNLIFILSPHAVNSPYCTEELEQALRYNKRIIPLLHVSQISRQTWQQRYPQGTETDWVEYQAKGLHSASRNIHPGIAKLNRINCRDGIDNPDQYLEQLVHTLDDRKDFVFQHTQYLVKALTWAQSQRQSRYLLTGAERKIAENWLKQAFEEDPPFCRPTDLHAEFITSSTKYADNHLTQVFLCYAAEDTDFKESLRRQLDRAVLDSHQIDPTSVSVRMRQFLMRAGFTVWDRRHDLTSGEQIQEATTQGIAGADNFIFLLSPQSVRSAHCLNELNYALKLNKRIIPVLIKTIPQEASPTALQNVRLIDLRQGEGDLSQQAGSRELIATLLLEAAYFQTHKLLLVQALKWEQQRYNPSLLLRGAEQRHYQSWCKVAQQRQRYRPVEIQGKFITESLSQALAPTLDVFLIADPTDLDFARRLTNTLQLQGKSTWFDQSSQVTETDTQAMVEEARENSQNFLVVLSTEMLESFACLSEVAHAQALNKRMIGVTNGPLPRADLPPALANCPIVNFQDRQGDFSANFGELYRILESDADHVDRHTRLLVRAIEWANAGREASLLLRGKALDQANTWLDQAKGKVPAPNPMQLDYIAASRELPFRKVRLRSVGLASVAVTLGVVGLRLAGGLQALELAAYDALMRYRPSEPQDSHLLIVAVDQASGDWLREQIKQGRYQPGLGTIPDGALEKVLAILAAHDPAAIGLDFYRDFDAAPALEARLRQSEIFFGICKATYHDAGVEQPPELPSRQVGFNDFTIDANNFVRRHYLKQEADPPDCDTAEAFSLRLARHYLEGKGIDYDDPFLGDVHDMAFGSVSVPQLWVNGIVNSHTGGYAPFPQKTFNGYQTLVNYRKYDGDPKQFAPQITLQEVMTGQFDPDLVKGRIVLIGYKDLTDRNADSYNTPQGELSGVVVHGQMTSQLVNAALEKRSLIWWWPLWAETLWIGLWALAGGLVARQLVRPRAKVVVAIATLALLIGLSYGALAFVGGWLPLVPALLAGLGTAGVVSYFNRQVRNP